MKVIEIKPENQEIIRRLATAVVATWDQLSSVVRDEILREACLATDPASKTTGLNEQITLFIRASQEAQNAKGA